MMLLKLFTEVWRAILFFPILENHSKRIALIYLSAQIISVVLITLVYYVY
jgi:hypothetical protein